MEKDKILIGVHTSRPDDEYAKGLISAFENNGVKALKYNECIEKNLTPNMTIGFDSAGLPHWQKILNKNIINILWSRDSVFSSNAEIIEQFCETPGFIVFNPSPCDTEPVGTFFPKLRHGYLPIGANPDVKELKPIEKEFDVVFSGNIIDIEMRMNELQTKMPEFVYKLMSDIFNISMENPSLSFWQIYTIFRDNIGLKVDYEQYLLLFSNLAPLITSHKCVQMIESLSKCDVKVLGNEIWKKYLPQNAQYLGAPQKEIIKKSKIALHYHPVELALGLHERILDAAEAGTFVVSSGTKSIELAFSDSMEYFDSKTFEGLSDKVEFYLKNDSQRNKKVKKAFDILKKEHTLTKRVEQIIKIMV